MASDLVTHDGDLVNARKIAALVWEDDNGGTTVFALLEGGHKVALQRSPKIGVGPDFVEQWRARILANSNGF